MKDTKNSENREINHYPELNSPLADKHIVDDRFLESLDEWVWEMDVNGIHTYSNRAVEKILGYKVEEVVGFSTTKLWHRLSHKKSSFDYFKRTLASGKGWLGATTYFGHKDGSIKILDSSAIPIYYKDGSLAGYRGIDRDITKKKENEKELYMRQKGFRMINKVLRHDIANNLNVINSAIRLFEQDKDLGLIEEIKKYLEQSFNLISDMSKLEDYMEINKETRIIELRDVIQKVAEKFSSINIELKGDCGIIADEMIYSVFDNLFSNAIRHGEADRIIINIEKQAKYNVIHVADNGKGIPDTIKDQVFEEGFKYGSKGNMGLGTFIIKSTLERYGGRLEIKDNLPQGTIFKIILPREPQ